MIEQNSKIFKVSFGSHNLKLITMVEFCNQLFLGDGCDID